MARPDPTHFDLIVIGAGAAGLSVTAGAAQLGVRVALVEQIFGVLSEDERGQLKQLLTKLTAAIGEQESGKAG